MSKKSIWQGVGCFAAILSLCFLAVFYRATNVSADSSSFSVTVSVQPAVFIVVNKHHQVQEIISNSRRKVEPTVFLSSTLGRRMPYDQQIDRQYKELTSSSYPIRDGVVYDASTDSAPKPRPRTFLENVLATIASPDGITLTHAF